MTKVTKPPARKSRKKTARKGSSVRETGLNITLKADNEGLLYSILRDLVLDTPPEFLEREKVLTAIKNRDVAYIVSELPDVTCRYLASGDTALAKQVYQITSFLKKAPLKGGPSEVDKNRLMFQKWTEAESACSNTNEKFEDLLKHFSSEEVTLLYKVREEIHTLLGEKPDIGRIIESASHGSGSSTDTYEGRVSAFYKWSDFPMECTPDCYHYLTECLWENRQFRRSVLRTRPKSKRRFKNRREAKRWFATQVIHVVSGSKFGAAYKSALVNRPTGIEPSGNMLLQKGAGSVLKEKLKQGWGYVLKDGDKMNGETAKVASLFHNVWEWATATVDLSSASDTIACLLVRFLLPYEWYCLLDDIRSKYVTIPGGKDRSSIIHRLHKFSSMGNGFTFELETIIFMAIARVAARVNGVGTDRVRSYGDDIVCPKPALQTLLEGLSLCGFSVNSEKSFWDGPFRESCGSDFHNGVNIRPYSHKKELKDVKALYILHNRLFQALDPGKTRTAILKKIATRVPERFRNFGPEVETLDTHLYQDIPTSEFVSPVVFTKLGRRRPRRRGYESVHAHSNPPRPLPPYRGRLMEKWEPDPSGSHREYKAVIETARTYGGHSWFQAIELFRTGRTSDITRRGKTYHTMETVRVPRDFSTSTWQPKNSM